MGYCVLVIDMQNDFIDVRGSEPILREEKNDIIANIERLFQFARDKSMSIIFTQDTHAKDEDFQSRGVKAHCIEASWGQRIIPDLKPEKDDVVIQKSGYSAFQGTDLERILREKEVHILVIVGVYTYLCVKASALDASKICKVILLKDCTSSDNLEKNEETLTLLQNKCEIKTITQFLEEFG